MNTSIFHAKLTSELLSGTPTDDDGLALMILLHTHGISLREALLEDRPGVLELAALTQRDAANVVASVWPDRSDRSRTGYRYWYYLFNTRTPYELVEGLPSDWLDRVQRLRTRLAQHPMVKTVMPED